MKIDELLTLLKIAENEKFHNVQEAYNKFLVQQKLLAELKKKGARNLLTSNPVKAVSIKELQEAWQCIDSENKYLHYRATGTSKAEQRTEPGKIPALIHLVKSRPLGDKKRRPPKKMSDKNNTRDLDKEVPSRVITPATDALIDLNSSKGQITSPPRHTLNINREEQQTKTAIALISPNDINLEDLQAAVFSAYSNYTNYHTQSENKQNAQYNRGQGDGFFSFLRHGKSGLIAAKTLYESVSSEKSLNTEETIIKLKEFLADTSRAYHHHSFASYLADALADKGLIISHKSQHYNQTNVVDELEQWLAEHGTTMQISLNPM